MAEATIFADSIPISTLTGIQLCPSLILSSPSAIPQAVKHIYSQLAANANELDEGVADLLLSLISRGNSLSQGYRDSLCSSLSSMVGECSTWLLSTGEQEDPLAAVAIDVLSKAVPQMREGTEVLHLAVGAIPNEDAIRVDASLNTLFVLCRSQLDSPEDSARFRAHFASRLSSPPPAFLIGMPGENSASAAPAILLSPFASSKERSPLAMALFAGASLDALLELVHLVEAGTPALILEDSCELCSLLHSAWLLTRSSHFSPDSFSSWLESNLEPLFSSAESSLSSALSLCTRLFACALSDRQSIDFISRADLPSLPSHLLSLCSSSSSSSQEGRILLAGAKLNCPSLLSSLSPDLEDPELMESLLSEATARDSRLDFLASLLGHRPSSPIAPSILLNMIHSGDKHFFCTIVLPLLGYPSPPSTISEEFAMVVDEFIYSMTGLRGLFPSPSDGSPLCLSSLSIWALLLHRPSLVLLLVSFSPHSLPLSLVISKMARHLARESADWFFYSDSLFSLSSSLSKFSLAVLSSVHDHSSTESYRALCHHLSHFGGLTITQLAYQTSSRLLLSHECCQRWVHRLLYGRLQLRPRLSLLPRWTRILLSASLVVPIPHLLSLRPPSLLYRSQQPRSPTVCLLHDIRQPRRSRALSTYSMISSRSDLLSVHLSTGVVPPLSMAPFTGASTPQSAILPMSYDEMDSTPLADHAPFHRGKVSPVESPSPTLAQFYSTPIVKYWLSLLFRLLYLGVFGYSLLLPGCGSAQLDTVVWLWSFIWWIESLWVAVSLSKNSSLSSMPWRLFDLVVVLVFLVSIFVMRLFGKDILSLMGVYPSGYVSRVQSSFLLLYQCYATILFYIPLSSQFGPLMVRVKMMIFRDFTNFLLLVSLIMLSSSISLFALSFPDRPFSLDSARSMLSFSALSLFTTDLSTLSLSDSCKKSSLSRPAAFCTMLNSNREPLCPTQSWPVYVTLLQFFICLKLILWPILFAFFAKTAKAVEDEADVIWKYQMYGLVHEFSLRPPLPPPLTPLFFLFIACCRRGLQTAHSLSTDHPDMAEKHRGEGRGAVYRNPSVPHTRQPGSDSLWSGAARAQWRKTRGEKEVPSSPEAQLLARMAEQLRALALRGSVDVKPVKLARSPYCLSTRVEQLVVPVAHRPWGVPLPSYSPPFYSRLPEEFPPHLQEHVESTTQQSIEEIRSSWRARQASSLLSSWSTSPSDVVLLSSSGLPLNPAGRLGISGRGNHVKFGPNHRSLYVIFTDDKLLLTSPSTALPSQFRYEVHARDEALGTLLRLIGLPEAEASLLSIRDEGRSGGRGPVHVLTRPSPANEDTDNSWREDDVWRVKLGSRAVQEELLGYEWKGFEDARLSLPPDQAEILSIALAS